jgi:alkylhydroperoxidase/carboxymuconolactone decarboxylase family protein YurZ
LPNKTPQWITYSIKSKAQTEEAKMDDKENLMSDAFQVFLQEAPQHAQAWMTAVQSLGSASALDKKTESLAYLAVLSVLRLESGIPFHVALAKEAGASREEVISAILVGLPAAGNVVTRALPAALQAYDSHKG